MSRVFSNTNIAYLLHVCIIVQAEGELVSAGETIAEIETDKATIVSWSLRYDVISFTNGMFLSCIRRASTLSMTHS
jgi:hypothetical protein